eukprot:scaffold3302_cov146-Skeletonema_menzelii.AAC.7
METPIPGHSAERGCKCAKIHDTHHWNANWLCLVQIAVDEWVAGRVDSRMPVKVCSEQLYLSRPNGSRNYDNVKLSRKNCC